MTAIAPLTTEAELDALLEGSSVRPAWLFKHSLVCPVSTAALDEYRRFVESGPEGADLYLIEIQRARPVSNAVAARTGVRHESPQALLLVEGRAVWNASHWSIRQDALEAAHQTHAAGEPAGG